MLLTSLHLSPPVYCGRGKTRREEPNWRHARDSARRARWRLPSPAICLELHKKAAPRRCPEGFGDVRAEYAAARQQPRLVGEIGECDLSAACPLAAAVNDDVGAILVEH